MSRANIKDVAREAGVSTATVSHVINGTRFVREETRRKVQAAIDTLNYQPSAIARSLATNATQTIGLIISDVNNPFFTAVARGVEDEFIQHNYYVIFCNTSEDSEREDRYLQLLSARQIDGLIMSPTGSASKRLAYLAAVDTPIVLIDRAAPNINAPLVEVDNLMGAYQATKYLVELGHRRIATLAGPEIISTIRMRVRGYRQALQEAEIPFDETLLLHSDPLFHHQTLTMSDAERLLADSTDLANAYSLVHQLFSQADHPTALFVTNNQMTLGALHALRERGLRCPDDVSVISFDDHDWAALFSPPLTVVRQPTYELGRTAARLLLQMMNQESPTFPPLLPTELIIRQSCRPI